jgi:AraC-like DNA-binding protein
MSTDVLSEVLHAVRLTGAVFYWVEASAPWVAVSPESKDIAKARFPSSDHVMEFHVLAEGECWVGLLDEEPVRAQPGDVIIFPKGDPHALRSARELPLPPPEPPKGTPDSLPFVLRFGEGGTPAAQFVCGYLGCDSRPFNPLIEALPRLLMVPSGGGALADLVRLAVTETATPRPGGEALRARLAEMMFVEAVRGYLSTLGDGEGGWLGGLRDAHVGRALALLHARPAHPWTTEELARGTGLSRTALHERFAQLVGQPPMQYLARWRMQMASSRLMRTSDKVASIALEVGYESEAAFNRAFNRAMGMPPATWRRERMKPPGKAGSPARLS